MRTVNGLKDPQIAELTNFVKQRVCEGGHKRVVISAAILEYLESNNLRLDSPYSK